MTGAWDNVIHQMGKAEFYLNGLENSGLDVFAAQCYFDAFVITARSVTYSIQKVLKHHPGFEEWYGEHQRLLKTDPVAKFYCEMRDEIIHQGECKLNGGSTKHRMDGTIEIHHYLTDSCGNRLDCLLEDSDAIINSRYYFQLLKDIVDECYSTFGDCLNPDIYYTIENLKKLGRSIEDEEEALGLPRGWTSGIPDQERLNLLKKV